MPIGIAHRPDWLPSVQTRLNELDSNWSDLWRGIGVSKSLMHRLKTGERTLSPRVRSLMAVWLHRTEAELFGQESTP